MFLGNTTRRPWIRKARGIRRSDRRSHRLNHKVCLEEHRPVIKYVLDKVGQNYIINGTLLLHRHSSAGQLSSAVGLGNGQS